VEIMMERFTRIWDKACVEMIKQGELGEGVGRNGDRTRIRIRDWWI
jgi:hypothetical protein